MILIGGAVLAVVVAVGWDAVADVRDARLDLRSEDRAAEWDAAAAEFGSSPVFGVGPGELDLSWEGGDGVTYVARYVHNEYLELLATFGLVGFGALVACGAVVVRCRRANAGAGRSALDDGALAALTVLAVHSGFDFLWHIPVLALVGGVLIGIVARAPTEPDELVLDLTRETESRP
jgi:O-antigen ligase